MEPSTIGKRMKSYRVLKGWSQNQMSKRSGVPRPTIVSVENGTQASISIENAMKLADALGITIDELVRGNGKD